MEGRVLLPLLAAAVAGMLVGANMVATRFVIGALLGREKLTAAKSAGVLLTIVGVGLALGERAIAGSGDLAGRGDLAVFASALTGAVCSVLYRPYLQRYPALPVSAFAMLAS